MHKDTKWAKQIISMQRKDGAWGDFHTLSVSSNSPITTEQALRRLERLGFTIVCDEVIHSSSKAFRHSILIKRFLHKWSHKSQDITSPINCSTAFLFI